MISSQPAAAAHGSIANQSAASEAFQRPMRALLSAIRAVAASTTTLLSGRFGWAVRIAVTGALLSAVLVRSDIQRLPAHLLRLDPRLLGAALLCSYLGWLVNSYKWQRLLAMCGINRSLLDLFRLNLAALLYGIALPGQITGEALKAIRLGRHVQSHQRVYVSVFLDRLTGVVGLAALGMAALLLESPSVNARFVTASCLAALSVIVAAGSAVLLLPAVLSPRHPILGRLGGPLARLLANNGRRLAAGEVVLSLLLAVVFQVSVTATNWLVAAALGVSVSPLALAWIVAVASLLQIAPISIAGIGPRESAYVSTLALYAVPSSLALTMSLLVFGLLVALGLTGGAMDLISGDTK